MSSDKSIIPDEDELVWLLRHKTRKRILLAIGDNEKISATALRDLLKISTGSLYYNLRQLKDFVTQDQERNYILTEEGKKVYKILKEGGTITPDIFRPKPTSKIVTVLTNIFFPIWLFSPIFENSGLRIITSSLSILVSLTLLIYTRTKPILFHISPANPNVFEIATTYFSNILFFYILLTVVSIIFSGKLTHFHKEGENIIIKIKKVAWSSIEDEQKFILSIFIAMLPLMIYPGILALDKFFKLNLIPAPSQPEYFQVRDLYITLAQVVALPFFISLTAYGRRLNGTSAALVVLVVYFISQIVTQFFFIG
ncbi:MAG: helix-turn-helix domain-containing protein [Nitrososphaerota archaeon]